MNGMYTEFLIIAWLDERFMQVQPLDAIARHSLD